MFSIATMPSLVMMAFVLTACGIQGLQDQHTVDVVVGENTRGARLTLPGQMPTFDVNVDCIPEHRSSGVCTKPTLQFFTDGTVSNAELVSLRNRLQDYLLWRSEQQCERHKAGILSTQALTNFGLNTITTGVSAVASIVVAPATNILAAIAAIASGTRSHFNEDFYRQYVGPAVVKRINTNRDEFYMWLMARRGTPTQPVPTTVPTGTKSAVTGTVQVEVATYQTVSIQEYSVWAAIADVERYQVLCSFSNGLASLVEPGPAFGDTATGIQQRIEMLRNEIAANDDTGKKLGATSLAAQELLRVNESLARQIMVLQQRLLTAPTSVGAANTKG